MKYTTITIFAYIPVLAAVIMSLYLYRVLGSALKALSWYVFLSGAVQFISLYFFYRKMNNLPLLHFYAAGGFVCLAWFYRVVLGNFINRYVIWGTTISFVIFCIANTLFIQPLFAFNSYALIVESVLVIILSLFTFLCLLNSSRRESGITDLVSISWINSGLFIYFLSCFLIYYFMDAISGNYSLGLRRIAWVFHAFFTIVLYSSFLVGLWKREKAQN